MHGGDSSVANTVDALFKAALSLSDEVHFILCGDESILFDMVQKKRPSSLRAGRFRIHHAPDTTPISHATISRYHRSHPENPLIAALTLQKEGKADITISAGDTGLLLTSGLFILGRQEGVERPALAAFIPTRSGTPTLLVDIGANIDCKPQHLLCFAQLGTQHLILNGTPNPSIALLNVGSEQYKGTAVVQEADQLLKESAYNYLGFIEADHVVDHGADIIVCDGFHGNIYLKSAESILTFMVEHIAASLSAETKKQLTLFNTEMYGSAPILGLNGSVYKAHGSSSTNALTQGIITAVKTVYLTSK